MASLREPHESTLRETLPAPGKGRAPATVAALVLMWSRSEPARVGEVLCLPRDVVQLPFTIGRADEPGEDGALPLVFSQLRPTSRVVTGPLRDARVSRWQLRVQALAGERLQVERLGRGVLRVAGQGVDRAVVDPGALIEVEGLFTLLYTRRPAEWPQAGEAPTFAFGAADGFGIVGESPAVWRMRDELALVAPRGEHVLVHGASGAGKELAARALHVGSSRAAGPSISRNAATIPGPYIDVELFGNLKDCPTPGMPARHGMLGEADGGSLLLDFVDELQHALQAHLLRAMDSGEYQRLGEDRPRTVDVRMIGATSRDPAELKPDLRARFIHHIRVPGLDERAEDIPLLARHLLRKIAAAGSELRARFFADEEPRMTAELIAALVRHTYTGHVRELHGLLWRAMTTSREASIEAPPGSAAVVAAEPEGAPTELTREQILAALAASGGVREQAWRLLGLRSRDQLKRLLKKFAIS